MIVSICTNLGVLGFFKYYNFFIASFISGFSMLGQEFSAPTLSIILPVGISFYTFQTLSYTIDVYRKKMEPTKDPVAFFAFVSFFPQLVAGPIERATNLLPQFAKKRSFDLGLARDGLRQILWGLLKKVVIADSCGAHVNEIFGNSASMSGSELALGAVYFAIQIYCDFSGYSDIAIGTARLFGFKLMRNFAFPYFSRNISDFWRRWHISLSTWFRDYVYIPLGGNRSGDLITVRNIFIVFVVSGFWHGANWTFIVWGFLHALFFIPSMFFQRSIKRTVVKTKNGLTATLTGIGQMLWTFTIVCFAWIFFRAENMPHAYEYIGGLFSPTLFSVPRYTKHLLLVAILLIIEWIQRERQHGLEIGERSLTFRYSAYMIIVVSLIEATDIASIPFIYFQF